MKKINLYILFITLFFITTTVFAKDISDYLILNDIGLYKLDKPEKSLPGEPPMGGPRLHKKNVLSGAGHFPDHTDITYGVMYLGGGVNASPKVEITRHTGGDSDRWLRHEIEDTFRDGEIERMGLLSQGSRIVEINGNKIIARTGCRWISNNNVIINISYTDLDGTKQEPLEVVQAYLAKFPSIITTTDTEFKSNDYNVQWIKDEIDRRLWLCDKWNAQFQAGITAQKDLIVNLISSMKVFLNYRQAYFGMKAMDDMSALHQLQKNKDIISINKKLTEYKTWWSANKGKSIHL